MAPGIVFPPNPLFSLPAEIGEAPVVMIYGFYFPRQIFGVAGRKQKTAAPVMDNFRNPADAGSDYRFFSTCASKSASG